MVGAWLDLSGCLFSTAHGSTEVDGPHQVEALGDFLHLISHVLRDGATKSCPP